MVFCYEAVCICLRIYFLHFTQEEYVVFGTRCARKLMDAVDVETGQSC